MAEVIEAPLWQSREFLQSAGRALMRWWNETGPNLPIQGEAFRGWWQSTYASLSDDVFAPSDVFEQLGLYADEARAWWDRSGRKGPPPPRFQKAPPLEIVSSSKLGLGVLLVGAAVALVWAIRK
jgi:hypothetical protein